MTSKQEQAQILMGCDFAVSFGVACNLKLAYFPSYIQRISNCSSVSQG